MFLHEDISEVGMPGAQLWRESPGSGSWNSPEKGLMASLEALPAPQAFLTLQTDEPCSGSVR